MIGSILEIVNKFIPDQESAEKVTLELEKEFSKQLEMKHSIIRAEQENGGIASKWRPWTMLAFLGMVITHWVLYDIVPYVIVVFDINTYTPLDPGFTDGFLDLIKMGLAGYIGGRSMEKMVKTWKGK